MVEAWGNTIITEIDFALHVAPGAGKPVHNNRAFHGFVLNDDDGGIKEYLFSDGTVMHTVSGDIFYLPRGSSYVVNVIEPGGCCAINFVADIEDAPFCIRPKNYSELQRLFKVACFEYKENAPSRKASGMQAIYKVISSVCKYRQNEYMNHRSELIEAAVKTVERDFCNNALSISALAELCGMSEVYFRKIFLREYGVSPKEYIIRKRIEYARSLLLSQSFSVSEVAFMCGYTEPCHFSREFSKRTGVSPSKYAAKHVL